MLPISVPGFIFLFLLFVTEKPFPASGDSVEKSLRYRAHQIDNFDVTFCASDTPSKVLSAGSISRSRCVLLCLDDVSCRGVNWKEPSTCEMFFFDPTLTDDSISCTYFSPGESKYNGNNCNLTCLFIHILISHTKFFVPRRVDFRDRCREKRLLGHSCFGNSHSSMYSQFHSLIYSQNNHSCTVVQQL